MTEPADNPGVIAPPPLIALAVVALGLAIDWLLAVDLLRDAIGFPGRLVLGGLLMTSGVVIAAMAERAFRRIGTNALPWRPALRLASSGLYAHTRNPMYLALALFVAGLGSALGSFFTLVMLVPGAIVMHYGVVLREERYLERKFGDEYRRFKAQVPRYGWRF